MKKQEQKNLKIIPNGMKKKGNLKSIFSDGTKIFIAKDNKKIVVSEKKHNNLFYFLYNNWSKRFMDDYIEVNRGYKNFEKTLNIYIPDAEFDKLKKGIANIKNTILLQFKDNQNFLKIMNETQLKIDKNNKKL